MLYLMALSDAAAGCHDQVLESIAKFATPSSESQSVLLARFNPQREDYLRQAGSCSSRSAEQCESSVGKHTICDHGQNHWYWAV